MWLYRRGKQMHVGRPSFGRSRAAARPEFESLVAPRARRGVAILASLCLVGSGAAGAIVGLAGPAGADTQSVNFESYSTGSVNGQDGWTATGSYDQEVVDNSVLAVAPVSF